MEEKIKKILSFISYALIWLIFVYSLVIIFVNVSNISEMRLWWLFLMALLLPLLSIFILRNQIKQLKNVFVALLKATQRGIKGSLEDFTIDKAFKLTIIASIFLVVFSVFYYYVIFLPQKEQNRIELQKQEQLKEYKEYVAKRKRDCLAIYKTESDKYSAGSVIGWDYIKSPEPSDNTSYSDGVLIRPIRNVLNDDTCEIKYKDTNTGEYFSKYY